jgi:hypothetical protein
MLLQKDEKTECRAHLSAEQCSAHLLSNQSRPQPAADQHGLEASYLQDQ